jgi:hypothetical protein
MDDIIFRDLFPQWEMSISQGEKMIAFAWSTNGLDWRCRTLGSPVKITLFSKGKAETWLRGKGETHDR